MERVDAIIAGVNKAGTTSLFVSLSEHPDVVPSAIKETRYFLPPATAKTLEAADVWDAVLRRRAGSSGAARGHAVVLLRRRGGGARGVRDRARATAVVLVLREPVARAVSFFEYQKVRLRFPPELTHGGVPRRGRRARRRGRAASPRPRSTWRCAGGRYADWLPAWWDVLGHDAVKIVWFEDLVADGAAVVRDVAVWLGLDPDRLPAAGLRSENRTTGFRHARLQRFALWCNDTAERWLRRVPGFKRWLRSVYFRINGRSGSGPEVSEATRGRARAAVRRAERAARRAARRRRDPPPGLAALTRYPRRRPLGAGRRSGSDPRPPGPVDSRLLRS